MIVIARRYDEAIFFLVIPLHQPADCNDVGKG